MKKKLLTCLLLLPLLVSCGAPSLTPSESGGDNPPVEPEVTLSSIEITPPTKLEYEIGEELDTTGLKVIAKYSDNSTKEVTDYTLSGFSSAIAGNVVVTVTYQGKTAAFNVVIKEKEPDPITLVSISVVPPTKLEYEVGDELDTTGLKVIAHYSDATTEEVTDYQLYGFSSMEIGNVTIMVTYEGKTTSFVVTIKEKTPEPPVTVNLLRIEVTPPTKTEYEVGEELSLTGMVVTAFYDDDTSKVVTNYSVSGFDSSNPGSVTVTVTFENKSSSFDVTIKTPVVPPTPEEKIPAERIYLSTSATSLIAGTTYDLKPVVIPEGSYKNPKFIIDNDEVIGVENNVATALSAGSSLLTVYNDNNDNNALDEDEPSMVMSFLVTAPEEGVSMTIEQDIEIVAGDSKSVEYKLNGKAAQGTSYGFYSNNSDIADFGNGTLVAYKPGECDISVSCEGYRAVSHVTVLPKTSGTDVLPTHVYSNKETICLNVGDEEQFAYTLYPENAKDASLYFDVSDTSVIEVVNGKIRAKKEGSALLKVSVNSDMSLSDSVIVIVSDDSKTYSNNYYNNYYGNLTWENGEDLKQKLHNIISQNKKSLKYNTPNWETNQNADFDLYDFSYMASVYGRDGVLKSSTSSGWQREHAFCASLMTCTTTGNAVKTLGRATDFHNLYAAAASGNSSRGNKNLGNANPLAPDYNDRDTYSFTRNYFEPTSEIDKGKLARAIFYMGVMYNATEVSTYTDSSISFSVNMPKVEIVEDLVGYSRISQAQFTSPSDTNLPLVTYYRNKALEADSSLEGNSLIKKSYEMYMENALPYAIGNLSTLLEWNAYAVSQEEMHHNESVYSYNSSQGNGTQGNRNPFVDYPELVNYIYGDLKDQPGSLKDLRPTYEELEMGKSGVHHYAIGENVNKDYGVGDTVTADSLDLYSVNYDLSIAKAPSTALQEYTFVEEDAGAGKEFVFKTDKNDINMTLDIASEGFVPFKDRVVKATSFNADKTYYLSADGVNFATTTVSSSALQFTSVESNIAEVTFTSVSSGTYRVWLNGTVLSYTSSTSLSTGGSTEWKIVSHNGGLIIELSDGTRFIGLTSSSATAAKAYAVSNLSSSKYPPVYLYVEK